MPVRTTDRQPDPLDWFGSERALPVLSAEAERVAALLGPAAPQPWLWLAPQAVPTPEKLPRCLFLHGHQTGFAGPIRCALPFPLPTEAFGTIVLQHVHESGMDGVLVECARLLEPGGRLWLISLNPWSPYRARWRRSGLHVREAHRWQAELEEGGLTVLGGRRRFGPVWRAHNQAAGHTPPRLRAVTLLEAEKRVAALIPPKKIPRWGVGASPV
jgi:SAM-dependent methyltransferase